MVLTLGRLCAACAAVLGSAAMGGLFVAVGGTPGLQVSGYVSELGAQGAPWARAYRAAILALGVGLALLAVAYQPVSALAATALVVAAAFATVSALVRCTPGCPLPPQVAATPADIVHASASIAAFVLAACAMLGLARLSRSPGSLRRRDGQPAVRRRTSRAGPAELGAQRGGADPAEVQP